MLLSSFALMPPSFIEVLQDSYRQMDKKVEDISEQAKVSCRKGCNACCKMLAFAVGIEGANIALDLLKRVRDLGEFGAMVRDLHDAALAADFEGLDNVTYFAKQIPCVFLHDDVCSIYSTRPAACRYHVVISPKENCSFGAADPITSTIDLKMLENVVWELDSEVMGGISVGAPIPIMVMWSMEELLRKLIESASKDPEVKAEGEAKLAFLRTAIQGVPSPFQWLKKHAVNVADSSKKGLVGRGHIDLPERK